MKKFIIIGNGNAVMCKEIFPLVKDNKLWLGVSKGISSKGGSMQFKVPNTYEGKFTHFEGGDKYAEIGMACWFTNIEHKKRNTPLDLYKTYSVEDYPKYDNYDAIESKTDDIPVNYNGVIGVPITFLDKYCPEQFEILGSTQRGCHDLVPDTKKYNDYCEIRQDGTFTGSSGNKTNENANLFGTPLKGNYFINDNGRTIYSLYGRIFIRKRKN